MPRPPTTSSLEIMLASLIRDLVRDVMRAELAPLRAEMETMRGTLEALLAQSDGKATGEPTAVTVPQAARKLSISRNSLYRLMAARSIKSFTIGTRRLVDVASLNNYQRSKRT